MFTMSSKGTFPFAALFCKKECDTMTQPKTELICLHGEKV